MRPKSRGGPDPSGLMAIGETENFEDRRRDLINSVECCYGHSEGNFFRYLCLFTRLPEVYPDCRLQYAFRRTESKKQAEQWEEEVKAYIIRRAQLPILNRQLPGAYNDKVWNAV